MTHIQLHNLTKLFKDREGKYVRAVDGISLNIEKGEFVTLLGPSGCGKTTTLRLIAGFEQSEEGKIFLSGHDISKLPPYERGMPMVFQSYALFPHLNVFQNIAYGLTIRKYDKNLIQKKVTEACGLVDLQGMEERYTGELSGGQQQRVALARALVLEPEIILFDEPLSNLDAKLRDQMRGEIKLLQERLKVTMLYVTHDQSEALSMSDKIVIMRSGKIEQVGTPEEIYRRPKTSFVSDFICNANFLNGRVDAVGKEHVTVRIHDLTVKFAYNHAQKFSKGEEVRVAIKPDALRFSDRTTGLEGKVLLRSFLGSIIEYKVQCGQEILTIHDHGGKTVAQSSENVPLSIITESCNLYRQ